MQKNNVSFKRYMSGILIVAFCLTVHALSFDKRQSEIWKNLAKGKSQRLVLSGTSLSVPSYSYWPDSLQTFANAKFGKGLLDIRNISPDGGNTSKSGPNCADSVEKIIALAPNAVILEFASNDATNYVDCTVEGCSRPSHVKMIDAIKKALPNCEIFLYVTGLPWDMQSCGNVSCAYCTVFEAQYCRRAARPSNNDHVEKYFDMVREEADHYYSHLIDTYADFKAIFDTANASYVQYLYDGHHPTQRATHEIILPHMLQALRGWPLVITNLKAGDTLTIGDSVHVAWEYDPDSVGVVEFQVSPDNGITWLPALNRAVQTSENQAAFFLPATIGGVSMVSNKFLFRMRKYNSNLADIAGPMIVQAGQPNAVRQPIPQKRVQSKLSSVRLVVGNRIDKLIIEENGQIFDIRGDRLNISKKRL